MSEFLHDCRLQKYAHSLKQQGVEDVDDLKELDEEELKHIAIACKMKTAHTRKFMQSVKDLKSAQYISQEPIKQSPKSPVVEIKQHVAKTDDEIIEQKMNEFQQEQNFINIATNTKLDTYLSLYKFSSDDICNKIKQWIYNDINYQQNLLQTMKIFCKHSLSGELLSILSTSQAKQIVQSDLLQFMTTNTLDIIFTYFDKWKHPDENEDIYTDEDTDDDPIIYNLEFDEQKQFSPVPNRNSDPNDFKSKSAVEIGYTLYNYPLNNLLARINYQIIDGISFIKYHKQEKEIIKEETGWRNTEIYQLESMIFQHKTFTKDEFLNNMDTALDVFGALLPEQIKCQIRNVIIQNDIQQLHYKIKNGLPIQEFSDTVINMVDELLQTNEQNKIYNNDRAYLQDDLIKQIYDIIARCFVFRHNELDGSDTSLARQQDWTCYNCGNCNFNQLIASKMNNDLSQCALCGIKQMHSIILGIKNHETFVTVNKINTSNDVDIKYDNIDKLIKSALVDQSFDLSCSNRNDTASC
eukprot:329843_1